MKTTMTVSVKAELDKEELDQLVEIAKANNESVEDALHRTFDFILAGGVKHLGAPKQAEHIA